MAFVSFIVKHKTRHHHHLNIEDTRKNFKLHGGIECLLDCYGRHQELVKEVISCLANVIEIDGT